MQYEVVALLLIAWPYGALWMVGIHLHASVCGETIAWLLIAFLNLGINCFAYPQLICLVAEWSILSMHIQAP